MAEREYVRDDHGRFAETGGGGGGGGKQLSMFASKGYASTSKGSAPSAPASSGRAAGTGSDDTRASRVQSMLSLARSQKTPVETTPAKSGTREWTSQLPPGIMDTSKTPKGTQPETWHQHYDGHPDQGGRPTPERYAQVHRPIFDHALSKVPSVAPGEKKVAVMTMGGPASGKSSMMRGVDLSKFVVVDPDEIKGQLPEYNKAVPKGGFNQGLSVKGTSPGAKKAQGALDTHDAGRPITYTGAASMVHEESSAMAKELRAHAIAQNKNVLIDGTGANAKNYMKTIADLKSKGYEVHVYMPHADVETGVQRALSRADKVGRVVPEEFIRKAYDVIPKNFEAISQTADHFKVFDTTVPPTKDGAPVKWSKSAGQETHHDPDFVQKFKAQHFSNKGSGGAA